MDLEKRLNEVTIKISPGFFFPSNIIEEIDQYFRFQMNEQVSLPFILLHGEEDRVTDKSVSELLYKEAASPDKTLKLCTGMWHGLLYGEMPDNIDIVFSDIIGWLDERSSLGNSRLERERKSGQDDGQHLKHKFDS